MRPSQQTNFAWTQENALFIERAHSIAYEENITVAELLNILIHMYYTGEIDYDKFDSINRQITSRTKWGESRVRALKEAITSFSTIKDFAAELNINYDSLKEYLNGNPTMLNSETADKLFKLYHDKREELINSLPQMQQTEAALCLPCWVHTASVQRGLATNLQRSIEERTKIIEDELTAIKRLLLNHL